MLFWVTPIGHHVQYVHVLHFVSIGVVCAALWSSVDIHAEAWRFARTKRLLSRFPLGIGVGAGLDVSGRVGVVEHICANAEEHL